MLKYVDDCVDCGLPCLGSSCPNKNVPQYYCDNCGDEINDVYELNGQELCADCLLAACKI